MDRDAHKPIVLTFAGPNGSGKTTVKRGLPTFGVYINAFETVMSTERNLLLLEKAKSFGYEVQCIYVLTCDENINVARVKARHAAGGHDVPEDKIRTRYQRALALIPQLIDVCDKMLIYDNSYVPTLIFRKENAAVSIFPNELWPENALRTLISI